jgi:DNA replication protein DnaC
VTLRCPVAGCRALYTDFAALDEHIAARHNTTRAEILERRRLEERRERFWKLVSGRSRMENWTLDTFPAADVAGRRALKAARDWEAAWEYANPEPIRPRLFIYGPPGTGKTGLAFALARKWIEDDVPEVMFENVRALLAAQRAGFARTESKSDDDDEPTGIERLLDTDGEEELVVLDDLGAERPTEFALETIALIIEHLHANDVPLIVTTNYAAGALAKRLGHADLVVGQRIVSRLVEDAVVIRLDRADLRAPKPQRATTDSDAGAVPAEGSEQ